MNSKNLTLIGGAVAVALAAGYPASAWYLGKRIEAAHAAAAERIASQPVFKLVSRSYERNLFDASETVVIEIPRAVLGLFFPGQQPQAAASATPATPAAEGAAAEGASVPGATPEGTATPAPVAAPVAQPPLRITFKTLIQHGPLPGFQTLAAGTAVTSFELDPALQQKVLAAFGGQPPVDIRTTYGFASNGHSKVTSPAFQFTLPGATPEAPALTLSGDATEWQIDFTQNMAQSSVRGALPRFEMSAPTGEKIAVAGVRVEAQSQQLYPDEPLLSTGTEVVSIASLDMAPGQEKGGPKMSLKEIKYDVQATASGDYLDLAAKLGAAQFQIDEQNYGPVAYDLSLKHLHGRKLVPLLRGMMALYGRPETLQDPARMMEAVAPMKQQLIDLLVDSPALAIDRIAFKTADGEASLSAGVRLVEAKAEDFANPMALLPKVDANATLSFPATLATGAMGGKTLDEEQAAMQRQMVEQQIAGFVQQGYATLENGILKSKLVFKGGQLFVNDKPFNPMAAAQAPQQ